MESKTTDNYFIVQKVNSNGNCLFESMSHIIYGSADRHDELRQQVADYYKTFNPNEEYEPDSIDQLISFGVLYDNEDANGKLHTEEVVNEYVWASNTDILVLCKIYKICVEIHNEGTYDSRISTYISKGSSQMASQYGEPKGHLLYSGNVHYDFMEKCTYATILNKRLSSAKVHIRQKQQHNWKKEDLGKEKEDLDKEAIRKQFLESQNYNVWQRKMIEKFTKQGFNEQLVKKSMKIFNKEEEEDTLSHYLIMMRSIS